MHFCISVAAGALCRHPANHPTDRAGEGVGHAAIGNILWQRNHRLQVHGFDVCNCLGIERLCGLAAGQHNGQ